MHRKRKEEIKVGEKEKKELGRDKQKRRPGEQDREGI